MTRMLFHANSALSVGSKSTSSCEHPFYRVGGGGGVEL